MADTPEAYYRNALDLNRFGNGVQKKLRDSYNRIIVDAVEKLSRINEMPLETRPKYKAARLKALLKQTTESLARWSGKSEKTVIKELQGLAKVQVDFAVNQLEAALPAGIKSSVNSVEVSASYAESVVTKKATDLNASLLSDDLQAKVKGVPEKFSLTAKKGSQITLPNGEILTKAFRGLASKQADLFGRNIRDGLLSGETTQQMARRLYGVLKFEGGGKATNNQISTLVKTSVQSVSNQAAQTVYEANQDISKEYRWIATLDSRTAPECRILDQTTHKYGQGPEPPQHFGCRCRTTAVLDYKGLGVDPPKYKFVKRSGENGSVPMGTSYGKWLNQQSASYKAKALGQSKVKYFNALSKKYGPDEALKKLVRQDGSSKTLKQLQKTYTKTPFKKLAKKTTLLSKKEKELLVDWEKVSKSPKTKAALKESKKLSKKISEIKPPSKALIAKEGQYMTAAEKAGKVKYVPLTQAQKDLIEKSVAESLAQEKEYKLLTKKVASIKNREDYIRQSKENEAKIRKLKSDFKKKTTKTIKNNDYTYYGEDLVGDKFVKVGTKRIKDMGYEIDNIMLDGTKKIGWSSKFEQLEQYIGSWKGGSASTQMAQAYQLEKTGAKLSTFAKFKATSAKKWKIANRNRFIKQADGLEEFIRKSPSYDGQIQRGMKIRKDRFNEFLEDLAKGKPTATLESWSSDISVADDFAGIKRVKGIIGPDSGFDNSRIHTMLTVKKNKYGSSITQLANDYQHEVEVLIPSKLRYKIVDIEQTPIGETGEMFWNIILEQI